ncbi:MAG: TIM23 complex component [Sclerophora amabilis]|nr:MAG: TIM23 complex component [Sclerophora amabilis]
MLSSAPSCLRAASRGCQALPVHTIKCTYSTSSRRATTLWHRRSNSSSIKSNPTCPTFRSNNVSAISSSFGLRSASSAPASAAPNTAPSADSARLDFSTPEKLDWDTFFKLRKSRRRFNLVASAGTSAGTIVAGLYVLAQQDLDPLSVTLFGLDPMLLFGLTIAGFGTVGWLAGPFLGGAMFRLLNKRFSSQIAVKEKEFYDRIKRYRVDPSSQSLSNPVPDYYGEKISSVGGYRQWMKDQRAYNKKRQSFV